MILLSALWLFVKISPEAQIFDIRSQEPDQILLKVKMHTYLHIVKMHLKNPEFFYVYVPSSYTLVQSAGGKQFSTLLCGLDHEYHCSAGALI